MIQSENLYTGRIIEQISTLLFLVNHIYTHTQTHTHIHTHIHTHTQDENLNEVIPGQRMGTSKVRSNKIK